MSQGESRKSSIETCILGISLLKVSIFIYLLNIVICVITLSRGVATVTFDPMENRGCPDYKHVVSIRCVLDNFQL